MQPYSEAFRQRVLHWLSDQVPESRIRHILGVEQTAIALAQVHQLDTAKVAQAGLMHDLAKYFKPQRLLDMARAADLSLNSIDEAHPHLLHADVGAIVAREEFGVTDPEVLAAIANHTLGQPGMDELSCVVFLADSIEPGRGDTSELNDLRRISRQNLIEAVYRACDDSLRHLLEQRRVIHPRTILTRNWFLAATRNTTSQIGLNQSASI